MKRLITGLVMAIVVVIVFLLRELSPYVFDVSLGVLTVFGAMEIAKIINLNKKTNIVFVDVLFTVVAYLWMLISVSLNLTLAAMLVGLVSLIVVLSLIVFVVLLCSKVYTKALMEIASYEDNRIKFCANCTLTTAFGFIYPTMFLLFGMIFNHIDSFSQEFSNVSLFADYNLGLIVLLFWIGTTVLCDTMAFYTGNLIGGKKLCPKISPNKTISGSIGGIVGSIIFGVIAYALICTDATIATAFETIGINYFVIIVFSLVSAIVTQLGDLFVSLLKRKANVKDTGHIFPGHGGVMDRCDGLSFNAIWILIICAIVF